MDVSVKSNNGSESSTTSSSPINPNNAPKFGTLVPNRIFVGGISASTTEAELLELFSKYGQVKTTKIIADRAGVSKGYGFVTFETEEEAKKIQLDSENIMFRDKKLNIAPAIKKQQPFPRMESSCSTPPLPLSNGTVFYPQSCVPLTYHNGMAFYAPADPSAYQYAQPQTYSMVYPTPVYVPQQYQYQYQSPGTPSWTPPNGPWRLATSVPYSQSPCSQSAPTQYVYASTNSPVISNVTTQQGGGDVAAGGGTSYSIQHLLTPPTTPRLTYNPQQRTTSTSGNGGMENTDAPVEAIHRADIQENVDKADPHAQPSSNSNTNNNNNNNHSGPSLGKEKPPMMATVSTPCAATYYVAGAISPHNEAYYYDKGNIVRYGEERGQNGDNRNCKRGDNNAGNANYGSPRRSYGSNGGNHNNHPQNYGAPNNAGVRYHHPPQHSPNFGNSYSVAQMRQPTPRHQYYNHQGGHQGNGNHYRHPSSSQQPYRSNAKQYRNVYHSGGGGGGGDHHPRGNPNNVPRSPSSVASSNGNNGGNNSILNDPAVIDTSCKFHQLAI